MEHTIANGPYQPLESILLYHMLPNPHAVGIPPDDGVGVLECLVVFGIFRTDENIMGLIRIVFGEWSGRERW
jgi:hypothetical protein